MLYSSHIDFTIHLPESYCLAPGYFHWWLWFVAVLRLSSSRDVWSRLNFSTSLLTVENEGSEFFHKHSLGLGVSLLEINLKRKIEERHYIPTYPFQGNIQIFILSISLEKANNSIMMKCDKVCENITEQKPSSAIFVQRRESLSFCSWY